MNMLDTINQILVLVIIAVIGFILGKLKFLDDKTTAGLSKILLNIALPANVIKSFIDQNLQITPKASLIFCIIILCCYLFFFIIAVIVPKLIKAPENDSRLYSFMLMFPNTGYIGYPVANAVFGPISSIYVSYFVCFNNILMFTVGKVFLSSKNSKLKMKEIFNPVIIATIVGILLKQTGIAWPTYFTEVLSSFSNIMTPLAMIITGLVLSTCPIKEIFAEWRILPVTIIKLVIIPIVVFFTLSSIISDPLMIGIATVISAMPVGTTSTILCIQHGQNASLASKTVSITTILTMLSIPALVYLLL